MKPKENGFQLGNENIYFTDFGRENIYNTCLTIFKRGISNSLIFLESNRIVMGLLDAAYQLIFLYLMTFKLLVLTCSILI